MRGVTRGKVFFDCIKDEKVFLLDMGPTCLQA